MKSEYSITLHCWSSTKKKKKVEPIKANKSVKLFLVLIHNELCPCSTPVKDFFLEIFQGLKEMLQMSIYMQLRGTKWEPLGHVSRELTQLWRGFVLYSEYFTGFWSQKAHLHFCALNKLLETNSILGLQRAWEDIKSAERDKRFSASRQ